MVYAGVDLRKMREDIRAGMDDDGLMDKYDLTPDELKKILHELHEAGLIRHVNAKEVVQDINAGVSNAELMAKYRLSHKGLQNLFDELCKAGVLNWAQRPETAPARISVNAGEIVDDIRAGLTDGHLRSKYGLSQVGLLKVMAMLVEAGALTDEDLTESRRLTQDAVILGSVRGRERYYLDLNVAVCDSEDRKRRGRVRDVTEEGVGIAGLESAVDEVKTLIVLGDDFGEVNPFEFRAICRWASTDESSGEPIAGFQVIAITDENMSDLKALIKIATASH